MRRAGLEAQLNLTAVEVAMATQPRSGHDSDAPYEPTYDEIVKAGWKALPDILRPLAELVDKLTWANHFDEEDWLHDKRV
jgi:hypothetical protein